MSILSNISNFSPILASIILSAPQDFLYGCISPDIFIGRGSKHRENHCHNWDVGMKLLKRGKGNENLAFAYGYLAHLASDIVAHNFFIPNQITLSNVPKKVGHIYWESLCDEYVEPLYFKIAEIITKKANHENNLILMDTLNEHPINFRSKKGLYFRLIQIQNRHIWLKTLAMFSKRSKQTISRDYFYFLNKLSYNLIKDFLINRHDSLAVNFDPVGAEMLIKIKTMKRYRKNECFSSSTGKILFPIPEEILNLDSNYCIHTEKHKHTIV